MFFAALMMICFLVLVITFINTFAATICAVDFCHFFVTALKVLFGYSINIITHM